MFRKKNKEQYEINLGDIDFVEAETTDEDKIIDKLLDENDTFLDIIESVGIQYCGPGCNKVADLLAASAGIILYSTAIEIFINSGFEEHMNNSVIHSVFEQTYHKNVNDIRKNKDYVAGYIKTDNNKLGYATIPINVITSEFNLDKNITKIRIDTFFNKLINLGRDFADKFIKHFENTIVDNYKFNCKAHNYLEMLSMANSYNNDVLLVSKKIYDNLILSNEFPLEYKEHYVQIYNGLKVYSSKFLPDNIAYAFNSTDVSYTIGNSVLVDINDAKSVRDDEIINLFYDIVGYVSKPVFNIDTICKIECISERENLYEKK